MATFSQDPVFGANAKKGSNAYASGANQNCGNVITDRPTTRLHAPPGGSSSICLSDGSSEIIAPRAATGRTPLADAAPPAATAEPVFGANAKKGSNACAARQGAQRSADARRRRRAAGRRLVHHLRRPALDDAGAGAARARRARRPRARRARGRRRRLAVPDAATSSSARSAGLERVRERRQPELRQRADRPPDDAPARAAGRGSSISLGAHSTTPAPTPLGAAVAARPPRPPARRASRAGQRPSSAPLGRGLEHAYASGANQNCGNVLTDRPRRASTRRPEARRPSPSAEQRVGRVFPRAGRASSPRTTGAWRRPPEVRGDDTETRSGNGGGNTRGGRARDPGDAKTAPGKRARGAAACRSAVWCVALMF